MSKSRPLLHDLSAAAGEKQNVTTTGWSSFCFGPEELKTIATAIMQCKNIPSGLGLKLYGHATNKDKDGNITGINFSPSTAKKILYDRQEEVRKLELAGVPPDMIEALRKQECNYVPIGTNLIQNAVFEESAVRAELPEDVREYYGKILAPITDYRLAITMFDDFSNMCIPIAMLKERLGVGKVILGKLGFQEGPGQKVYDWQFGEGGVRWV